MRRKTERNEEIYRMWLKRKPHIGYKKIANIFGFDYTTIRNIIKSEQKRVGKDEKQGA